MPTYDHDTDSDSSFKRGNESPPLISQKLIKLEQPTLRSHLNSMIGWSGDAMLVQQQQGRGHKGGDRHWKYVYANPLDPATCPVLAVAVYVFSRAAHSSDISDHNIYDGSNCEARWPNSIIALTLRMGHSIPKVKDKYINNCEEDQLRGRMRNWPDFTSEMFAILPPHFLPEADRLLTDEFWNNKMPGYYSMTSGFRAVLPFLLASLVHHEDFVRATLPAHNPIFGSRVFTRHESLNALKDLVTLGVGRCRYTGMQATGIPPHLIISGKVKELEKRMQKIIQETLTYNANLC
jgi:hypothetical protein